MALSGYDINLEASGTGKFVLRGNGTYSTGEGSGSWTEAVQVMVFRYPSNCLQLAHFQPMPC
ncbi:MAG: hypothetical protein KKC71_09495 [Chloroflexi bacterium]|nr:hypothetical protein [Chloroflexota bacterium]